MTIGDALHTAVTSTTKEWTRVQRKAIRNAASFVRSREQYWRGVHREMSLRDAAFQVMPEAYRSAAGRLNLAHARQVMYAARPLIQGLTDKPLDPKRFPDYFSQVLLPDYQAAHPAETASWDVVYDARGDLIEPHTGAKCPLGTLSVRRYLAEARDTGPDSATGQALPNVRLAYPTTGPRHRYTTVLVIEKEGFLEHLKAAGIAERYDVAVMTPKGMSTTAARTLLEGLEKVRFLVLHDFDKSGFSIVGTLTRDTARYRFRRRPNVVDLGLRLADVQAEGLEPERCDLAGAAAARNLRENGATPEEIAFLLANGGQRVELNAFGTDAFLAWLERKLKAAGVKKVVPEAATLAKAYRRATYVHAMNKTIEDAHTAAEDAAAKVVIPPRLADRVRDLLATESAFSWDVAVALLAGSPDGPVRAPRGPHTRDTATKRRRGKAKPGGTV